MGLPIFWYFLSMMSACLPLMNWVPILSLPKSWER